MTLPYNLVMLAVDIAAIRLLGRRRGFWAWCGVMSVAGIVAVALGVVMGGCFENPFGIVRLWTYGLLLHGPVLLAATAIIRRRRWACAVAAVAAMLAMISVAAYAFLIEPHWLEVTHYRIASRKISRPVRIVVVADLQTDNIGPYEREALRRAMAEKPDLLLFAGDYIQTPWKRQEALCRELNDLLREIDISAPLGVFAVRGNVDPHNWEDIFQGTGATAVDIRQTFDLGTLRLTCLTLRDSTSRDSMGVSSVAAKKGSDRYHIILGHVPNFALSDCGADLLIAGHTHGGQVRLPWLGPIIVNCEIPRRWACGLSDLPGGGKLMVSRGVGMERGFAPRFRFLCRPELVVIDLAPEE
ncbi:MAG: metallophosphoesterase [Planctomycetes bacterium]|nr:metallophosphoesterase [Planctomycetota bacterium]MCG2683700.1 metallophosphoesterase [Planctomycetales bacterium]